jgi:uncharacterized membrane protein
MGYFNSQRLNEIFSIMLMLRYHSIIDEVYMLRIIIGIVEQLLHPSKMAYKINCVQNSKKLCNSKFYYPSCRFSALLYHKITFRTLFCYTLFQAFRFNLNRQCV